MKMNRLQLYAKAWMGLINILLIKRSQTQKNKFYSFLFYSKKQAKLIHVVSSQG